jgi:uncharacterized membrane protein
MEVGLFQMEVVVIARTLHVMGVVVWIGGVAMVTLVIVPALKRLYTGKEWLFEFELIEKRFSVIARWTTIAVGATGFYMVYSMNAWLLFTQPSMWWLHAMTLLWLLFSTILFVLEPFVLRKKLLKLAETHPDRVVLVIERAHWLLLFLSTITVAGAVIGSHG